MAAPAGAPLPPHYEHLGVAPAATLEEVRSAYRRAALATHPDKGGDSHSFIRVVRAFEVLSDPEARRRYDRAWLGDPEEGPAVASRPCKRPAAGHCDQKERMKAAKVAGSCRDQGAAVLDCLFAALRAAPAAERQELLVGLGGPLRAALLSRFERHGARSAAEASEAQGPEHAASSSESESEEEAAAHAPLLSLMDAPLDGDMAAGTATVRGVCRRSARAGCPLYQAGVTILKGLHARSTLHSSLEAAVEQHIALLAAKKEFLGLTGSPEERIRAAFTRLAPCGTRYACQVHAYLAIGRKLYSPETLDVDAAVAAWRRLYGALGQGWAALREAWIEVQLELTCSAHPGRPKGIHRGWHRLKSDRTRSQLEVLLKSWEEADIERRERLLARTERRSQRQRELEREVELQAELVRLRRGRRVAALAERYAALVRQERQGERRRLESLHRTRLKWHRRKDLTMEEILRGPPM